MKSLDRKMLTIKELKETRALQIMDLQMDCPAILSEATTPKTCESSTSPVPHFAAALHEQAGGDTNQPGEDSGNVKVTLSLSHVMLEQIHAGEDLCLSGSDEPAMLAVIADIAGDDAAGMVSASPSHQSDEEIIAMLAGCATRHAAFAAPSEPPTAVTARARMCAAISACARALKDEMQWHACMACGRSVRNVYTFSVRIVGVLSALVSTDQYCHRSAA